MFSVNWMSFHLTDLAIIGEAEQYEENKKTLNINDGRDFCFPQATGV